VTRRTLDIALPVLYAAAIVVTMLVASTRAVTVVGTAGALVLGLYFGLIRANLRT
jgi:hypothetical protein